MKFDFKYFMYGIGAVSIGIGTVLGIDSLVFGSIYHPLTYFYALSSWALCQDCSTKPYTSSNLFASQRVVTSQHEATHVGLRILEQGGNAIDAAVAVGFALAVTDPCCGNIGGGGFALYRTANGSTTFINFREKAPQKAYPGLYLSQNGTIKAELSKKGYRAVAVPGTVAGLDYMLQKYGSMSRTTVMQPAIELAEKGFVLGPGDLKILKTATNQFKKQPNVASIFLKSGNQEYQAGDKLVQKNLANTLKSISKFGQKSFYLGQISQKIVGASQQNNGILTLNDFKDYTVDETVPITCKYRQYQVISAPPPGSGVTLCQMLNILEGYDLQKLGFHSSQSLHLILSSMMFAYADRNSFLGDPRFIKNPTEKLLDKNYAKFLRQNIIKNQAPKIAPQNTISRESPNTTHYSIYDKYGNSISLTYTINGYFGAGVIASDTGFFLNNEMDDFAIAPNTPNSFGLVQGENNKIESGKRPLSSMSPTIVLKENKPFLITGSPGGSTIPTTVLQVLLNVIDYGLDIDTAVNAARLHYQGNPNIVITEPFALKSQEFQSLWQQGFKVIAFPRWGAANSILITPNLDIHPAFDFRKTGSIPLLQNTSTKKY